jgi:chromosome segregation ATPase
MPFDTVGPPRESVDRFPSVLTSNNLSRVDSGADIQAMASSLDASEMESERRLLAERKIELDRRKSVLQRMQDETQALHREALEMRLTTEQLWIELSEKAPADHVNELLASLRGRLDEHYTAQQKTIGDRKSELVDLKQLIEAKQEDIREQSSKLQEWVESRHDEIKSFAAEVDAREMLLDHREHRMREEFAKWEAQRGSYQQQLQGLLQKLNLSGIGE